jgi:hypothetical protein
MGKGIAVLILVAVMAPCFAQTRAAQGKGAPRVGPAPKAHFNSTAKDTTPFQCETLRNHPYPAMQSLCNQIESDHIQSEARRAGRPGPSSSVIDLPPLGSADGKRLGVVCIGGQAMRKIPNGWEQVWSRDGWQRCRGG